MEYSDYDGSISISCPQTIHEADEADPVTWEMRLGTYGKVGVWVFYDYTNPISGSVNVGGTINMSGPGNRWGIDPCYLQDGTYVAPDIDVKYHITENYTLLKK